MCFEDNRRQRRVELICECREVRSNRDNRNHCDRNHDRNREVELRCECRECNRRNFDRRW